MAEIWKDVKNYEGFYQISNIGRVKSLDRYLISKNGVKIHHSERILVNRKHNHGYRYVTLAKNGKYNNHLVHRLVALMFIDNTENKRCVNHMNCDKTDNRVENLEWCTHSENNYHALANGKIDRIGIHNGKSKLTEDDVRYIRKHYQRKGKIDSVVLGDKFGVSSSTILGVVKGETWSHVR